MTLPGEAEYDRTLSLLSHPDSASPEVLIDVEVETLFPKGRESGFTAPVDVAEELDMSINQPPRVNVTPKYSFVDLHIGKSGRICKSCISLNPYVDTVARCRDGCHQLPCEALHQGLVALSTDRR